MKILVVALDNLGDTVMATAAPRLIRAHYPEAFIGMWVKTYSEGLLRDQSLIDAVHSADPFWDRSPGMGKGSIARFWTAVLEIRREKYDAAIILNTEWRRTLACRFAGIKTRIGYQRRKSAPFLTKAFPPPDESRHFIDDHKNLLELWLGASLPESAALPRIDVSAKEREWALAWLASAGVNPDHLVVIHPFAGNLVRCWPLSHWIDLMKALSQAYPQLHFVVLSGPGDLSKIEQDMDQFPPRVQVLHNQPIDRVKGMISVAQLFIGVDSGPGHVSAALGRPTISLYSLASPKRAGIRGNGFIKIFHAFPIDQITVNEVRQAAVSFFQDREKKVAS